MVRLQERASSRVSERSSVDTIGTVEVEDSDIAQCCPKGIFELSVISVMALRTVFALSPNAFAIAYPVFPSLCSSRIAASRFSFSYTERAGGDLGVGSFS